MGISIFQGIAWKPLALRLPARRVKNHESELKNHEIYEEKHMSEEQTNDPLEDAFSTFPSANNWERTSFLHSHVTPGAGAFKETNHCKTHNRAVATLRR